MLYKEVITKIIESIGGFENLKTIKKTRKELIIITYDGSLVDVDNLKELHKRIKKVELEENQLTFHLQKRDVTELFNAFKELPEAEVKSIKDTYQEEEPDQSEVPFFDRLHNTIFGDAVPLLVGMVCAGYLVGIVNFVGHILGM